MQLLLPGIVVFLDVDGLPICGSNLDHQSGV